MEYKDNDTHVCLVCHSTIVGLDNYISHKKSLCYARKTDTTISETEIPSDSCQPSVYSTLSTSMDASDNIIPTTICTFSQPITTASVDPIAVLSSSQDNQSETSTIRPYPSISDFLSSLELQIRSPSGPTLKDGLNATASKPSELSPKAPFSLDSLDNPPSLFDQSRPLKLSSILKDLDFSSDSDGFIPSDAEDLLDFGDIGVDSGSPGYKYQAVGRKSRSGSQGLSPGKIKPSAKLVAYKLQENEHGNNQTSVENSNFQIAPNGGKWRPGEAPQSAGSKWSIGKYKMYPDEEEDVEDAEDTAKDEEGVHSSKGKNLRCDLDIGAEEEVPTNNTDKQLELTEDTADVYAETSKSLSCIPCNKNFASDRSYQRHLQSALHKRWSAHEKEVSRDQGNGKVPKKSTTYNCVCCKKAFNNKNNFIRHIISGYHSRRAENEPEDWLSEDLQILLLRVRPFQCRICRFYCNESESFLQHCVTESHSSTMETLVGPVKCNICGVKIVGNDKLASHLKSDDHLSRVKLAVRPCVLRESRSKLKCPICHIERPSLTAFKAHMKLHENTNYVPKKVGVRTLRACEYCGKKFTNSFNLALHVRRKHTNERPFKCRECHVGFADKSTLNLHYKSRHHMKQAVRLCDTRSIHQVSSDVLLKSQSRKYKCGWCSFVVHDHKLLRPHYISEHAQKMFPCEICGLTFRLKIQLTNHLASAKHKAKQLEAAKNPANSITCPECNQKFFSPDSYEIHSLKHTNLTSNEDVWNLGAMKKGVHPRHHALLEELFSSPQSNARGKNTSKVRCPECHKEMARSSLVSHLRQHFGCAPFKCVYCSKSFSIGSVLHRHLKSHLNIRTHKCKYCPMEFSQAMLLTNHLFKKHRESARIVPSFRCDDCGSDFVSKGAFTSHKRHMHSPDQKHFVCEHPGCDARFLFASKLAIHKRKHSGERPYLCDQCGYAGKTRNQLTRHHRTHSGERNFHCEYCTYQASVGSNLRRHMRIHTGVKPYQCPYCDYSCNTLENIRKHITKTKKHQGKDIYPCKKCDFQFSTNSASDFRLHMTETHSVSSDNCDLSTVIAGIYRKDQDVSRVPEGSQALPLRTKSQPEKPVVKPLQRHDHAYTAYTNENSEVVSDLQETTWKSVLVPNPVRVT